MSLRGVRRSEPRAPLRADGDVPDATVLRLPLYLRVLHGLADTGLVTVSSGDLAAASGVKAAKLRRDLSHLGSCGRRGIGYDVATLIERISGFLGLTRHWSVALVGVGSMGRALARYDGFRQRGFRLSALFDADRSVVGLRLGDLEVLPVTDVATVVPALGISIGVVATPATAAQEVAEALVAAGVTGLLNLAPVVLQVPDHVDVRRVDLGLELQLLAFHEHRSGSGARFAETAPRLAVAGDRA